MGMSDSLRSALPTATLLIAQGARRSNDLSYEIEAREPDLAASARNGRQWRLIIQDLQKVIRFFTCYSAVCKSV
jgi:hypothetical protein